MMALERAGCSGTCAVAPVALGRQQPPTRTLERENEEACDSRGSGRRVTGELAERVLAHQGGSGMVIAARYLSGIRERHL